jgi:hypothetical protein
MRAHGRREMGACGCCNGSTGVPMLRTMIGGSGRCPQMIGPCVETTVPAVIGSGDAVGAVAAGTTVVGNGTVETAFTGVAATGVDTIVPAEAGMAVGAAGAGTRDENQAEIAGQFS